ALPQGWNFIKPWEKVSKYNVSLEQGFLSADKREGSRENDSFDIPSRDGKMINVDIEFSYRFDDANLPVIYTTFRGKSVEMIRSTFMRAKIKAWASEVSAKYTVIDIYGEKRQDLNRETFTHLKEMFIPYGIVIESANFSRITVDQVTEKAIQQNINARQELVTRELQVTEENIKIAIEEKKSLIRKIQVDAMNYEMLEKAKAEAKANDVRNSTITTEMIELEKIRKWDGKLPTYTGTGSSMINVGK
ncbi:MAG: SPFH domain-containing protein, partial [Fusobacteriaceae bacterium]